MKFVEGKHVVYSFAPDMQAVLTVDDGDIVVFGSNDCFQQVQSNNDVLDRIDHERLNPATGPVFVKGAKPGDLLKVDIMVVTFLSTRVLLPSSLERALLKTRSNITLSALFPS